MGRLHAILSITRGQITGPRGSRTRERRQCVYCGYSGFFIQLGGQATGFECPACQGDLYARPARTYGEMEGFAPVVAERTAPPSPARRVAYRLIGVALAIARLLRPGAFAHRRARLAGPKVEMGSRRGGRARGEHSGGRTGEGSDGEGRARGRR